MSFHDHQHALCQHLRAPDSQPGPAGVEARRLAVYKNLIYASNEPFLRQAFPVYHQILDAGQWHQEARRFLMEYRSQSPFFHDISKAYVDWLAQRPASDLPRVFAAELVHYEWLELAVSLAFVPATLPASEATDPMAGRVRVNPSLRCARYRFPVHRISATTQPVAPPDSGECYCFAVFRDQADRIRFLQTNELTNAVLDGLLSTDICGREIADALAWELPTVPAVDLEIQVRSMLLKLQAEQAVIITN